MCKHYFVVAKTAFRDGRQATYTNDLVAPEIESMAEIKAIETEIEKKLGSDAVSTVQLIDWKELRY
jgi:hypothetical protein